MARYVEALEMPLADPQQLGRLHTTHNSTAPSYPSPPAARPLRGGGGGGSDRPAARAAGAGGPVEFVVEQYRTRRPRWAGHWASSASRDYRVLQPRSPLPHRACVRNVAAAPAAVAAAQRHQHDRTRQPLLDRDLPAHHTTRALPRLRPSTAAPSCRSRRAPRTSSRSQPPPRFLSAGSRTRWYVGRAERLELSRWEAGLRRFTGFSAITPARPAVGRKSVVLAPKTRGSCCVKKSVRCPFGV